MNGYIADAIALVHFFEGLPLNADVRDIIADDDVAIASTTVWELAIKIRLGKLADITLPEYANVTVMFHAQGFAMLDLTPEIAEAAARLPLHHKDPFDRALIAMAVHHGRTIITSNRVFADYGVTTVW